MTIERIRSILLVAGCMLQANLFVDLAILCILFLGILAIFAGLCVPIHPRMTGWVVKVFGLCMILGLFGLGNFRTGIFSIYQPLPAAEFLAGRGPFDEQIAVELQIAVDGMTDRQLEDYK